MKTNVTIWSAIGHTPVTHRGGLYCDELIRTQIDCETPDQARLSVQALMLATPGADRGFFHMPDYWNQNTRSGWV
jgi:hypothetical protein